MVRRILILSIAALALVAFSSLAAESGKMVTYQSGSETVSSYLSAPAGTGKKPGLVVIQELLVDPMDRRMIDEGQADFRITNPFAVQHSSRRQWASACRTH